MMHQPPCFNWEPNPDTNKVRGIPMDRIIAAIWRTDAEWLMIFTTAGGDGVRAVWQLPTLGTCKFTLSVVDLTELWRLDAVRHFRNESKPFRRYLGAWILEARKIVVEEGVTQ